MQIEDAIKTLFFISSISGLCNTSSFSASKFKIAPGPTTNFMLLLKNTDGNCFVTITSFELSNWTEWLAFVEAFTLNT